MKNFAVTRRQVLRGAGGVSLGLPLLPSLFPRRADGAEPMLDGNKFFVAAATQHGAIGEASMYPAASSLTQSKEINPGHMARYGALTSRMEGTDRVISSVMRAPASKFPEKLVAKMNVMRGFEIPYYIGHHTGGHLGNFVRSDQGPKTLKPFPTIDQVMAWSPKFYKTTAGIKQRSIVTGQNFHGMSFSWSNPANQSGTVEKVEVDGSSNSLFDKLIAGVVGKPPVPSAPPRKPIVDHVIENYRSLKTGNKRLSQADKVRLDDHLGRLDELQRRVNETNVPSTSASCTDFKKPVQSPGPDDGPAGATKFFSTLNEVVTMAFACGTSRVATMWVHSPFHDSNGWHQDTAHQWDKPDAQMRLVEGLRNTFAGSIVDLATRLDSIEIAPGLTILDQSLYQWTQESGWATHDAQDMPIVTFGKAGGYLKTGQFVDFRNMGGRAHLDIFGLQKQHTGIWVRQWLATALQAMGIPPSDFEKNGKTGYGDAFWEAGYDKAVHANVINRASDPVAIITG